MLQAPKEHVVIRRTKYHAAPLLLRFPVEAHRSYFVVMCTADKHLVPLGGALRVRCHLEKCMAQRRVHSDTQ